MGRLTGKKSLRILAKNWGKRTVRALQHTLLDTFQLLSFTRRKSAPKLQLGKIPTRKLQHFYQVAIWHLQAKISSNLFWFNATWNSQWNYVVSFGQLHFVWNHWRDMVLFREKKIIIPLLSNKEMKKLRECCSDLFILTLIRSKLQIAQFVDFYQK